MHSPPPASLKVEATEDNDLDTAETLPPSPTWSDAVTAPESNEDVIKDSSPSPEKRKDDGTTDLGDTVTSHPNLGPTLANFLEKIVPWKGIMPESLIQDMRNLEDVAARMRQTEQPVNNMGELDPASTGQSSLPILLGDASKPKIYDDGRLLQRVQLNSFFLSMELSTITVEHRLVLLKDQLREMQAKHEHSKTGSIADTSPEIKSLVVSGNECLPETSEHSNKFQEDKRKNEFELMVLTEKVSQLKCLLDFIQTEPDLQRTLSLRAKIEAGSLETIRFQDIWLLFEPGDLVVSKINDHWRLHKVYSTTGGQIQRMARGTPGDNSQKAPRVPGKSAWTGTTLTVEEDESEKFLREANFGIGTWTSLKVDCYSLGFDGDELRPIDSLWKIKHFLGEKRITDLPLYPVRFHPDKSDLLERTEARGLRFLMSPGHKSYKGPSARPMSSQPARAIDGDVYVEFPKNLYHSSNLVMTRAEVTESEELVRNSPRWLTGNEVDALRSEEFMSANRFKLGVITTEEAKKSKDNLRLLPWVVRAYIFRIRDWENLDIDLLQEIDRRPEARDSSFNELVIPDKTRTLLVSLVEDHASKAKAVYDPRKMTDVESSLRPQVDLVRGKGQGLIILLHGPPGSGKTSTAETIAAYTQRPLYSITCGDLGLEAQEVEDSLSKHTERAEKWGCVLLLDEADVFLMQRNWHDMGRNALVSVFLRELEYYSGILFLTTNRPGVIDEAFLSRIHMAFRYSAIDLASTKVMWYNIMDRIERDNKISGTEVVITFRRDQLLRFAEKDFLRRERQGKPWNGRQIRNAFNTAIGLGRYQRLQMLSKKAISPEEASASGDKQLMEIKLTKTNFQDIATAARSFEDYIQDLRGVDSEIARLARVRDDNWGSEGPVAVKDYSQIRKTTMPEPGVRSRSFVAKGGLGMREPDQSRARPNQTMLNAKVEGHVSELDNSEDSDDSSDNDG
ncbi:hypothetical protein Daus18300_010048 [Diaporthe australafricana]|uniref:AAA+ ATPase domain-containing protein n=1 Tax=Diaporthe australafricana TaxID=127596 RepID=A0ABR3WBQ5_9PEZI